MEKQQLLHLLILISLALFFTSGSFSEQIYWSCIFLFSGIFSDYFILGIFYALFHVHYESIMAYGTYRIPAVLCYLLFLALLTVLLTLWLSAPMTLPLGSRIITLTIPPVSVFISDRILLLGIYLMEHDFPLKIIRSTYLVNMLFLSLSLFLFLLTHYLGSIFLKNLELQRMNQEKQIEQAQFDLFQDTTQKLRVWKHDFKNHLLTLNGYLQKNETQMALDYLESILKELNQSKWETFSGNSGLDALLSVKHLSMEQEKILFKTHVFLPKILPVSNLEFSALIGNALDNAIEACKHLRHSQTPWISLEITLPLKGNSHES
ncbi:MAG: Spo0B domain-containing protein [Lachnospiraceae bacterium]|nr:Spo0B domain-containing protein [Lachnospiraceae bacterium]